MAKSRTLNEIRQSKEYQQAVDKSLQTKEVYNTADQYGAVYEIVENLTTHMFDIIFEAVNDEMHKYTVFQEQTYLTDEGMDMFEDQWFEFYHENHGIIMHKLMSKITN